MTFFLASVVMIAPLILASVPAQAQETLQLVRERGYLRCAVSASPGLAELDPDGRWRGFQIEQCRALAAAVLKDAEAFEPFPVSAASRFDMLRDRRVEVSLANITWTLTRETTLGLTFTGIFFFDGQGFAAQRDSRIFRLADAAGRRVCVVRGTTTEANLRDYNRRHDLEFEITTVERGPGLWTAFVSRLCDVVTGDGTDITRNRVAQGVPADQVRVLPDVISREPLSPMVRADDPQWESIVRWVLNALILAEEKGLTAADIDRPVATDDSEALRLVGALPGIGGPLGLDDRWAARAVRAVGHYGELFERTLGAASRFRMKRGINRLWRDGGLIYAPALR